MDNIEQHHDIQGDTNPVMNDGDQQGESAQHHNPPSSSTSSSISFSSSFSSSSSSSSLDALPSSSQQSEFATPVMPNAASTEPQEETKKQVGQKRKRETRDTPAPPDEDGSDIGGATPVPGSAGGETPSGPSAGARSLGMVELGMQNVLPQQRVKAVAQQVIDLASRERAATARHTMLQLSTEASAALTRATEEFTLWLSKCLGDAARTVGKHNMMVDDIEQILLSDPRMKYYRAALNAQPGQDIKPEGERFVNRVLKKGGSKGGSTGGTPSVVTRTPTDGGGFEKAGSAGGKGGVGAGSIDGAPTIGPRGGVVEDDEAAQRRKERKREQNRRSRERKKLKQMMEANGGVLPEGVDGSLLGLGNQDGGAGGEEGDHDEIED